jgi:MinD-like ATPase involved in chromosome partitioning or flagellar assembly
MIPAKHQLVRMTVVSPFGQHDIDLPADAPVSGFLHDLLAMVGVHSSPARLAADGWHLADPAGRPIASHATLAEHGIGPGSVVQLRRPDASADGGVQMRTGVGIVRDAAAVSRHLPRGGVPPAPPDDHLTPLERVDAMMPQRVGKASRLLGAGNAFLRGPEPPHLLPPPDPPTPDQSGLAGSLAGDPSSGSSPASPSGYFPDDAPVAAPGALEDHTDPGTIPALRSEPIPRIGPAPVAGPADTPASHAIGSVVAPAGEQRPTRTHGHEAGRHRYRPADLTIQAAPSRLERARVRWRELDNLGRLDARITGPRLMHCATIAVVSPKGGVGKTTVTALLGTLFSLLRRDPIVAVDTNPDFGSLGRVLTPDQQWFVDDLARLVTDDDELSLTALDSLLGRAVHGLLVVPAPTDPQRMTALDEDAYRRVITRLKDFFSLILLDCGTGLQDPALAAAIAAADQVVLLTDAQPATASLVAESTDLLHQWGKPITVVVNRMPVKGAKLDVARLSGYLPAARGLVVVPDDVVAATRLATGRFDWRDAPATWQFAVRRLATVLVTDWQRLGLAR